MGTKPSKQVKAGIFLIALIANKRYNVPGTSVQDI